MFMNTKKSSTYLFHGRGYFDYMYVCGPYACQVLTQTTRGQWIPGKELHIVVSHHVCAGTQTQVLWKNSMCS